MTSSNIQICINDHEETSIALIHSLNDDNNCFNEMPPDIISTQSLTSPPPLITFNTSNNESNIIECHKEQDIVQYNLESRMNHPAPISITNYVDPDDIDMQVLLEENKRKSNNSSKDHSESNFQYSIHINRSLSFQDRSTTMNSNPPIRSNSTIRTVQRNGSFHNRSKLGEYHINYSSNKSMTESKDTFKKPKPITEKIIEPIKNSIETEERIKSKNESIAEFYTLESNYKKKLSSFQMLLFSTSLYSCEKKNITQFLEQMIKTSCKILQEYNESLEKNNLGSILLSLKPEFDVYFEYTKKYNSLVSGLQSTTPNASSKSNLDSKNSRYEWLCSRQELDGQSIKDAVLFPVSHLMHIQLNLKAIIDKSDPQIDMDYDANIKALEWIKELNDKVDAQQAVEESMIMVFEMQKEMQNCPTDLVSGSRKWILSYDAIQYASFDKKSRRIRLHIFTDLIVVAKIHYPDDSDLNKAGKDGRFVQPSHKAAIEQKFWYTISRDGISQLLCETIFRDKDVLNDQRQSKIHLADSRTSINKSMKKSGIKEDPRFALSIGFDKIHIRTEDAKIIRSQSSSKHIQDELFRDSFISIARMSIASITKNSQFINSSAPMFGKHEQQTASLHKFAQKLSNTEKKKNIFGLFFKSKSKVDTSEKLIYGSSSVANFNESELSLASKYSNNTISPIFENNNSSEMIVQFRFMDAKYRDVIHEELNSRVQEQKLLHHVNRFSKGIEMSSSECII